MKKLSNLLVIFLLCTVLCSCSGHEKHGEIVKDSKGNYYELDGNEAFGDGRYLLKKVDTLRYKPVGF